MNRILLLVIMMMFIVITTSDQIERDPNPTPDDKGGFGIMDEP